MPGTGPRTQAGKLRSAQNAKRHGLSAKAPRRNAQLQFAALVDAIAGPNADEQMRSFAALIAQSAYRLREIRTLRAATSAGFDHRSSLQLLRLERYQRDAERSFLSAATAMVRHKFDTANTIKG